MFKLTSAKTLLTSLFTVSIILTFNCDSVWAQRNSRNYTGTAIVEYIIDERNIMAISDTGDWNVGEILPIISQNSKIGVFAYTELSSVKYIQPRRYELRLKLLRQSRTYLIQQGDYVKRLNLDGANADYIGTTDLLVKNHESTVSAKYKPLVHQGIVIGETAQTLYKNEILINFLGNAYYGLFENFMIGSYLPLNVLTGANGNIKYKLYDSESTTISSGLSYADIKEKGEQSLNFNFYWDSVSTVSLISHIYVSLGLIRWEDAGDATAIKALGSSSFQTGYEVILSNWDRLLVGPSYNFDKKALGGYLAYVWIWDQFHMEISINTTNVTSLKINPSDGYYGFFDLYWRF